MTTAQITNTEYFATTRFGEIGVVEDLVIHVPTGLIGFEKCTRFVIVHQGEENPFKWFQSLDDSGVAFPIIEPSQFKNDYVPIISGADTDDLQLKDQSSKIIFIIVTVPAQDPRAMTANLLAPLVINPLIRRGKQVIVLNEGYTTRHRILAETETVVSHAA